MKVSPIIKNYCHKWNNMETMQRCAVAASAVFAITVGTLFAMNNSKNDSKTAFDKQANAEANYNKATITNQETDTLDLRDAFNNSKE